MYSRDIHFLLFYTRYCIWTLRTTLIQLVSVLLIAVVLHCPYSTVVKIPNFFLYLIVCEHFCQFMTTIKKLATVTYKQVHKKFGIFNHSRDHSTSINVLKQAEVAHNKKRNIVSLLCISIMES